MISDILNAIERGLGVVRLNTKLLLVVILLFVFPTFFMWVTQGFFTASFTNIKTVEKQNVAQIHDSLGTILASIDSKDEVVPNLIANYVNESNTLDKLRVLEERDGKLEVVYANEESKIGEIVETDNLYRLTDTIGLHITTLSINEVRTWQSFSNVKTESGNYYIFSETSYAEILLYL